MANATNVEDERLETDRRRLRSLRRCLFASVLFGAFCYVPEHFELAGARSVFAVANLIILVLGAILASASFRAIACHRRLAFLIDAATGLGASTAILISLRLMYTYGILRP